MIIQMDRPFANDHLDGPGLANDHPEWLASCKWSSAWICLLQIINRIKWPLANDHLDGSFFKYHPFFSLFIFSSRDQTPKNSRIIGQYTHNILSLKTHSFSVLLFIHKNMNWRSPNWVRLAKCTWSCWISLNHRHSIESNDCRCRLNYKSSEDPSNIAVDPLGHLTPWEPVGLPLDLLEPSKLIPWSHWTQ